MPNTITITSKDKSESQNKMYLLSLVDYQVETKTIQATTLADMLFSTNTINDEMREWENAAIYDFLKFEEEMN